MAGRIAWIAFSTCSRTTDILAFGLFVAETNARPPSTIPGPVIAIFAHGFGGSNGLPLPRWLLAYLLGFAIVLAFIVLRVVAPTRRRPSASTAAEQATADHATTPSPWFIAARVIGLALFLAT